MWRKIVLLCLLICFVNCRTFIKRNAPDNVQNDGQRNPSSIQTSARDTFQQHPEIRTDNRDSSSAGRQNTQFASSQVFFNLPPTAQSTNLQFPTKPIYGGYTKNNNENPITTYPNSPNNNNNNNDSQNGAQFSSQPSYSNSPNNNNNGIRQEEVQLSSSNNGYPGNQNYNNNNQQNGAQSFQNNNRYPENYNNNNKESIANTQPRDQIQMIPQNSNVYRDPNLVNNNNNNGQNNQNTQVGNYFNSESDKELTTEDDMRNKQMMVHVPDEQKIIFSNDPGKIEIVFPPTVVYDENLSTTTRASILGLLNRKKTTASYISEITSTQATNYNNNDNTPSQRSEGSQSDARINNENRRGDRTNTEKISSRF